MLTSYAAMILAAGRGERMRPLTETCPKPLIEVAGMTMLDRAYAHVKNAGISKCVVNAHYLGAQIQAAAEGYATISHEETLLETAGGVMNALPLLDCDPIFVLNGDVVWLDPEASWLRHMATCWTPSMTSLLMLIPRESAFGYEGRGDFFQDAEGRLRRPQEGEEAPYIYGGVQMIARAAFEGHTIASFSFNVIWNQLMTRGELYGVPFKGPWFHIGTPEDLTRYEPTIQRYEKGLLRYGSAL